MSEALVLERVLAVHKGGGISASGRIPGDCEFFQDHFPSFPVLPGVLALELLKQTAENYFSDSPGSRRRSLILKKVESVKFSKFLRPGDHWESRLELLGQQGGESEWKGRLLSEGKTAVVAKFRLAERSSH